MTSRTRRGGHVLLAAFTVLVVLSMGALVLDIAFMLTARRQAQDVADAASQAAIVVLRQSGDPLEAEQAARTVVGLNRVAGRAAELITITFGRWVDTHANPRFEPDDVFPNAVRVEVGRVGGRSIPFLLATLFGYRDFEVVARSTSASRSLEFVIVMDITGSWNEGPFREARRAAVKALDMLRQAASEDDEIGMAVFTNRYGWEYTPFVHAIDTPSVEAVRAAWMKLNIASKAGIDTDNQDGRSCSVFTDSRRDDFSDPPGGCYPDMPREYSDEPGTDHSTGVLMARQMFEENTGQGARYRAMLVLTDGRPASLGSSSGNLRAADGYTETRWREYRGPVPKSQSNVRSTTIAATNALWDDYRVHTWVVSLIADDSMMHGMVHGDGYYIRTSDEDELEFLFSQIVSEMPLAIVE